MKTAEEILDLYIQEQNEYLDSDQKSVAVDAMKFYANQKLDEAAENAEMTYHCGHTKNNLPTKYHQSGADNIQINKQSILNLKDEI